VRIQEAVVSPGDNVQVGPVMFVVQINGVPADEEIQPVVAGPAAVDDTNIAQAEVEQLEEVTDEMPQELGEEAPLEQLEDEAVAHLDSAEGGDVVDVDLEEVEEVAEVEDLPEVEGEADNRR
jgi:hypothetical protein